MDRYSIALGKKPADIGKNLFKKKVNKVYEVVYTLGERQNTFSLNLGEIFKPTYTRSYELKKEDTMLASNIYIVDNFAIWLQKEILVKEFKHIYGGFKFWSTESPEQKEKWGNRWDQVGIGTTGVM